MPKRIQASKRGFHESSDFSAGRLAMELRRQWQKEHPSEEVVPATTTAHIERAKQYPLPEDIDPDSMVAAGFHRYLEIRGSMSRREVKRLGFKSAGAATERLVCNELLLPDQETAPVQDVLEVSRGISIARIALSSTLLHE